MAKRGKAAGNEPGAANTRSLSRTRIIDAALAMIDRDGVDAFSMRSLAADLDVTPMALYNHVGGEQPHRKRVHAVAVDHGERRIDDPRPA